MFLKSVVRKVCFLCRLLAHRKTTRSFLVFLVLTTFFGIAFAAQPTETKSEQSKTSAKTTLKLKKRLAVLDFEVKAKGAPRDAGSGLAEMLITALVESERFTVVERTRLDEILREQRLGITGAVNPKTAAQIGQLIGAQLLIKGVITEFEESKEKLGGGGISLGGIAVGVEQVRGYVAMDIRGFDAITGTILFSHRVEGEVKRTGLGGVLFKGEMVIGGADFKKTALGEACRKAINDAVNFITQKMEDIPWEGRIVLAKGDTVYINAGADCGLKLGDIMEVYQRGEELVDPETGESLGYQTSKIGYVEINRVEEKFSTAQVIVGSGGRRNDIIKFFKGDKSKIPSPPDILPANPSGEEQTPQMKIMVVIPEVHISDIFSSAWLTSLTIPPEQGNAKVIPVPSGENEIVSKLLESGFDVVDPDAVKAIRYDERTISAIGDAKQAAALGKDNGADVIIIGKAFSGLAGKVSGDFVSCRAVIEAKAIDVNTGNILASKGQEGSGMDAEEFVAAEKAFRQAGSELADYFISQLRKGAKAPATVQATTVEISLSNVTFGQLKEFEQVVQGIEGVKKVNRLSFSQNTAKIQVEYAGSSQELADKIFSCKFTNFQIEITGFSESKLEINIKSEQ
jgi:curli biogenesis system outer membrane secretion channel CsgG